LHHAAVDEKRLIQTRVSKALYNKVVKLAADSGSSMATWVRQLLVREVKASKEVK